MQKTILVCLFAAITASVALAAGNWPAAQREFNAFERKHADLRRLTPRETRKIVDTICKADEDERKDAAKAAGSRAKKKVAAEYKDLAKLKDKAISALDDVLDDTSLSTHHPTARKHRKKVNRHWTSIGKMTKRVRGANHPVISYMLDQGNKAHSDYQKTAGNCDAYEFSISTGRADCIKADTSVCTVIELKPDNRNAVTRGKTQAGRYARELNSKGSAFKELVKRSAFSSCKSFKYRVDCYTLCPEIDENGEFQKAAASWRKKC